MNNDHHPALVVAVASRALFDLDESHRIFEQLGEDRYAAHQREQEHVPLRPGVAFRLVKKLLALNVPSTGHCVEVILLSRNSTDSGLRIMNSIRHYGLDIRRAAFTRGRPPYRYAHAFGAKLFLSANGEDVRLALAAGMAAATVLPSASGPTAGGEVKIAFDGDAVIFSDESERVYIEHGLAAFNDNEVRAKSMPLPGGPLKPFLAALHALQASHPDGEPPIRTALITARSAPAHERVIRTLRSWGIRIDEALFLGGLDKGVFLESFDADIFFDDQHCNCEAAANYVTTGHVPYGIKNVESLPSRVDGRPLTVVS